MYCGKCGNLMDQEAKFCGKCGTVVSADKNVTGFNPEPIITEQQNLPPLSLTPINTEQQNLPPTILEPANTGQQNLPPASAQPRKPSSAKYIIAGVIGGILLLALGAALTIVILMFNNGETSQEVIDEDVPIIIEAEEPDYDADANLDLDAEADRDDELDPDVDLDPNAGPVILEGSEIFEQNADAVFQIITGRGFMGSGFFVCSSGIAVTNHHVIAPYQSSAVAITHDGREFDISGYYFYDVSNDIAIIQVDGEGVSFPYVSLDRSDTLPIGAVVYAIGSPYGDRNTITDGIISRIVDYPIEFCGYEVDGLIQITAAVYGGSSGGPVFNSQGHVIGVVAATSISRGSVGFAVPISRVQWEAETSQLKSLPITTGVDDLIRRDYYERFPSVPTLAFISEAAHFIGGGFSADLGIDIFGYERAYIYSLSETMVFAAVDEYEVALLERGFIWQDMIFHEEADTHWIYFYHEEQDISVSLWYHWDLEEMVVALARGNIYEQVYVTNIPSDATVDEALVGTWDWDEGLGFIYIFNDDGTGSRGFPRNILDFYWLTYDGNLYITIDLQNESWSYIIIGDILILESNQIPGIIYSYIAR